MTTSINRGEACRNAGERMPMRSACSVAMGGAVLGKGPLARLAVPTPAGPRERDACNVLALVLQQGYACVNTRNTLERTMGEGGRLWYGAYMTS
jgi:hypothetical protein